MNAMLKFILLLAFALAPPALADAPASRPVLPSVNRFALWGAEALGQIRPGFYLPEQHLYGEEIGPNRGRPKPAFVWPSSIMLSALAAAAKVDEQTYLPMLREYIDALRTYRTNRNGITGLDVWPAPKTSDRYYDDNAWMALALAEAYQATRDARDLQFADEALKFTLSGEDGRLGGGIYWHEDRFDRKHAVSCGPAICAAIILYQQTREKSYLDAAQRLYGWTRSHLRTSDDLYADSIGVADGAVDAKIYSYNTATMIRAGCLLFCATGQKHYLQEAQDSAKAAVARWVRSSDGAIVDESPMAHKLCESLVYLSATDHDPHWRQIADGALKYLHERCRDPNGWYGRRWDESDVAALDPVRLLDQASAARAFWVAAGN